jgi:hypothetical protein
MHALFWLAAGVLVLGMVDPLEGSVLVAPATAVLALLAHRERSPERRLLGLAFGLTAIGVAAMWGLSAIGGIGGDSGHSLWWAVLMLPYPVGWLLAIAGVVQRARRGDRPHGAR